MKRRYREVNLRPAALEIVRQANEIIEEYLDQGLRLTLRQLYYQFVSRDLIPNTQKDYKRLASIVSDGRLAGLIDWSAIEDRGREPNTPSEWSGLRDLAAAAVRGYRLPRWEGQTHYCELWVEKQALAGVLEPLASEFHATLMVNKGYSSQSAMYESAQRFLDNGDRRPALFYLGDHDPSGEDMVRDIRDRMEMFGVTEIEVTKIALTIEQVRKHRPPPNPAKITDPRAAKYIAIHGPVSWEVDALNPSTLARLIRGAFEEVIDLGLMNKVKAREESDKKRLLKAVEKIQ